MENATKALLIAAAVLVVIMVISLGIAIYRMGSEAVGSVSFTQQEVAANNEKFTKYNGTGKRGTEVRAMLQTVLSANIEATMNGEDAKIVTVKFGDTKILLSGTEKALSGDTLNEIQASKSYNIVVKYEGDGGLVNEIKITERS